jgi:uroporphyrinogen-III synthase
VRVVVTMERRVAQRLAKRLRREGFDVVVCPLVRIESVEGPPIRTDGYDWLLLTSANAVEHLFARLEDELPRVAVVGPGTAAALRERGVEPAFVANRSTQEGLVAELPRPAGRVLFAGAEGARDLLVRELGADFIPLYRTIELRPPSFPDRDLAILASASAARALTALDPGIPCVSIGPVTSAEAVRGGLEVVAEAKTHDLEGLVAAVKLAASRSASSPS